MKILSITQQNTINNNKTFQKGMPSWFPAKSCEKSVKEMEAIMKEKGVEATFKDCMAVAASCLATAEIFEAYKLPLPSKFSYSSLPDKNVSAVYDKYEDTVIINSDNEYFGSFLEQDFFESLQSGTPVTKYFLHTYLHEFMHAAHFNNINDNERFNQLRNFAPTKLLVEPINTFLKNISNGFFDEKIDEKYPAELGNYSYTGLTDFVADRGANIIEKDLLDTTMVKEPDENSKYTFISPKGDELFEFEKEKTSTLTEKLFEFLYDRQKVLKAIWDGDIDFIKSPKNKKFIREI